MAVRLSGGECLPLPTALQLARLPMAEFGPGGENSPGTVLVFGTHGNESPSVKKGIQIVRHGLHIPVENGVVKVVFGNPRASVQGTRFSEGGSDLNRMWANITPEKRRTYEFGRARRLDEHVINDPDIQVVADWHATTNPKGIPFAIAEPGEAERLAATFPVEIVASGFDDVEPGGLDHGANLAGKVGICLEAGFIGDEKTGQRIDDSITALLVARGHTDGVAVTRARRRVKVIDLFHGRKGQTFTFSRVFPDFGHARVNEPFGTFEDGTQVLVRDASLGNVERMSKDGITEVVTMFAGGTVTEDAPNGKKLPGLEPGVLGVEGPLFQ